MNLGTAKPGDSVTIKYSRVGDLLELAIQVDGKITTVMVGVHQSKFAAAGNLQNADIVGDIIEVREEIVK